MNKPDITLSTGRVVTHKENPAGYTDANLTDGGEMTEAEWQEYCEIVRKTAK